MPHDAGTLAANPKSAVVAGDGGTLTTVTNDDARDKVTVQGVESVDSRGRSVAISDQFIWVDAGPTQVAEVPRDGSDPRPLDVPPSAHHLIAASRDALWVYSPDTSEISRFPIGGAPQGPRTLSIERGAGTQLAVKPDHGYVLYATASGRPQSIYTVDRDLSNGDPPEEGLTGSAIKTGDEYLVIARGDRIELVNIVTDAKRWVTVGRDAHAFDYNAGRLWVAYDDGTLRRFDDNGDSSDPLKLPGAVLAIDARDDRAWVLIQTSSDRRELLDVRP
jgi:hypothetical protein